MSSGTLVLALPAPGFYVLSPGTNCVGDVFVLDKEVASYYFPEYEEKVESIRSIGSILIADVFSYYSKFISSVDSSVYSSDAFKAKREIDCIYSEVSDDIRKRYPNCVVPDDWKSRFELHKDIVGCEPLMAVSCPTTPAFYPSLSALGWTGDPEQPITTLVLCKEYPGYMAFQKTDGQSRDKRWVIQISESEGEVES